MTAPAAVLLSLKKTVLLLVMAVLPAEVSLRKFTVELLAIVAPPAVLLW